MQIIRTNKDNPIVSIDAGRTMYPTIGYMIENDELTLTSSKYSTMYGYSFGKSSVGNIDKWYEIDAGQYFSIPVQGDEFTVGADDKLLLIDRKGYQGQFIIGSIENRGRLCYIDGCSDSMLVYPPRFGDPTLNSLHFPSGIQQTFHTHPSIRIGCIAKGSGSACSIAADNEIKEGDFWLIEEQELHRFRTDLSKSEMIVIAFHPDSEWGPTDYNHTMLNRTYIKK